MIQSNLLRPQIEGVGIKKQFASTIAGALLDLAEARPELLGESGSGGEGDSRRPHSSGRGSGAGRRRKARQPGLFEIQDISPPPRSLGIHALPPVSGFGCCYRGRLE